MMSAMSRGWPERRRALSCAIAFEGVEVADVLAVKEWACHFSVESNHEG
jgi:hypothetical protein